MHPSVTESQAEVIREFLAAGEDPEAIGHTLARLGDLDDSARLRIERVAREIKEGTFVAPADLGFKNLDAGGGRSQPERKQQQQQQQQQ